MQGALAGSLCELQPHSCGASAEHPDDVVTEGLAILDKALAVADKYYED